MHSNEHMQEHTYIQSYSFTRIYLYLCVCTHHTHTHFFPWALPKEGVADFLPELLAPLDTEAVKEGF